jgi:3-oxoadipate enol-lactonase
MNVPANGITFNLEIDGPEGAPWLVFSNSLCTNLHMWDAQAAYFKSRFRVLRYDQRGHGETDAPPGRYTFDLLVSDVVALFDTLGIDRAHFAGCSMGGMTTLGLAEQHPDRVITVAPCDTTAYSTPEMKTAWEERIAAAQQNGVPSMLDTTINRWFPPETVAHAPFIPKIKDMIVNTSLNGYVGCCSALSNFNYQDGIAAIRAPLLVIVGTKDQMLAGSRAIHRDVPGSTLVELEGAGHLSSVDAADGYNRALDAHISNTP